MYITPYCTTIVIGLSCWFSWAILGSFLLPKSFSNRPLLYIINSLPLIYIIRHLLACLTSAMNVEAVFLSESLLAACQVI